MERCVIVCFFVLISVCLADVKVPVREEEKRSEYWFKDGQKYLRESIRLAKNDNRAKNVIFFLGDGMGITTVTATRIYKGQKRNKGGVEEQLTFDKFPHVSLSKTYGVDVMTSDSANTATAYLCGVKANYGTIGVDGRVKFEDCESSVDKDRHVHSVLQWAQDQDKWAGLVTSTRVTHATPAGLYAHTASRNWESSTPNPKCSDIAHQLVHDQPGKNIRVIMGGGRRHFLPRNQMDVDGAPGSRNDSRNILDEWKAAKKAKNYNAKIVFDAKDLKDVEPKEVDFLLGLFHADHLPYVADRPELAKAYPTLPEMTEKAIRILSKNPGGYFLLVEGGKIDIGHHMNWAQKALEEGVEFDQAISTALQMTDRDDTLIVVTADHSHTFTVGGDYPLRGTSIVGLGGVSDIDNKTFTTLGYHNGPGYKRDSRDRNLTQEQAENKNFRIDSVFPMSYETHGAEDVPVYAIGPMSHLFHGVHEQSYIPYVMGYAACVGPNQDLCSSAWTTAANCYRLLTIAMLTYLRNKFL